MNIMIQNCLKYFVPAEKVNFDESVIKYYERHGCKQFIRGIVDTLWI